MILIGSRAIRHHFPDFTRELKDWDYLIGQKDDESHNIIHKAQSERHEFHVIPMLFERYQMNNQKILCVLTSDHLYTLKISHIFWPIKQEKHLYDIRFLKNKGCKIDQILFDELFAHWTHVHGPNTRLNFDNDNDKFFDDFVDRKHKHDDLHVMMNPDPLYLNAKENVNRADISQEIFFKLPLDMQMDIVREEAYVLALERILIPGHKVHWRVAYTKMIRVMLCRLTPRWLGLFIVDNYYELIRPKFNFLNKYKSIQNEVNI